MNPKRKNAQNSKRTVGKPFKKGVSGNPGGRPKTPEWFKEHTPEALKKILELLSSRDEKIAFQAAQLILAYSLGKPMQSVEHSGALTLGQLLDGSWDKDKV